MKTNVYLGIAVRIIILFTLGMLWTYIPEQLRDFFGDIKLSRPNTQGMDKWYEWGARHIWYAVMMFLLFMLSLINVIMQIRLLILNNYELEEY